MKLGYKKDFLTPMKEKYTTFPPTEQTQKILAKNNRTFASIASKNAESIKSSSLSKLKNHLLGRSLNIYA